jgi:ATP-dependent HslUV protease ATP-binding subunit HslU
LIKQSEALLKTEGLPLEFTDEAIFKIAEMAFHVNAKTENIGARRLHTMLENLLESLSFEVPDLSDSEKETKAKITAQDVEEKLGVLIQDEDLSRYIL